MPSDYNFVIQSEQTVSLKFLEKGIDDFNQAMAYIKQLPYRRNTNKYELISLFDEECGTCSTKHAILNLLASENGHPVFKLFLGIFKMNSFNTPAIKEILLKYNLDYILEVHSYIRINNEVIDCTYIKSSKDDFIHDLLEEIEIKPEQITDFKVNYHKAYLQKWLASHAEPIYTIDELWYIRELCIHQLSLSPN